MCAFLVDESEDANRRTQDRDKSRATLATCGLHNFLTIGLHTDVMHSLDVCFSYCQSEDFDPALVCQQFRALKGALDKVFITAGIMINCEGTYLGIVIEQIKRRPRMMF